MTGHSTSISRRQSGQGRGALRCASPPGSSPAPGRCPTRCRSAHFGPRPALNDRRIAPALSLIHASPQRSWTVGQLASKVGLSRSPFSVRFGRVVGESPHAYIIRVRMLHAARMLKEADRPVADVALSAGFESESSFSKAFKRHYGKTPGQFRRTEQEATPSTARLRVPSHDGRAITRGSDGGLAAERSGR